MINNVEGQTPKTEIKQNKLAVFEHIKCKEKKHSKVPAYRRSVLKHLAPQDSDNELSQEEDDGPRKKRFRGVRLVVEPLKLTCLWKECGVTFDNYHAFIKHIFNHMEDIVKQKLMTQSFTCCWGDSCNIEFSSLFLLKQHATFHGYLARIINIGNNVLSRVNLPKCLLESEFVIPVESDGYKCELCGIKYCTIYEFYEHVRAHANSNTKYCKQGETISCDWKGCTYKFSSQYKLIDHLRTHTKEKIIACPTCLTMFTTKTKFNDHYKRQLPIELQSYQCSQCSKLFPSERLLRDHMRSHINLYKCTMCDMSCAKPSALRTHIRIRHLLDRPWKCTLCDQSCVSRQALEMHLLTHLPEKLLACEECDFHCRSMVGLDKHYQVVHGQGWSRTYECHCCRKQFPLGKYLTKHLMKAHNFHWPSGHSRFRYKEDRDGIFRLQTVRYESIEVTQEIIGTNDSETMSNITKSLQQPGEETAPKYVLMFAENGEKNVVCPTDNTIVIAINDVDESGNVVNSQVVQSNEMKVLTQTDPLSF